MPSTARPCDGGGVAMKHIGTFRRVNDPATHLKGFIREPQMDDSISRIAAINNARSSKWHTKGLNSWSSSDWLVALVGEVGEACNIVKKLNRVRDGLVGNKESPEELRVALGKELADIYLYLDLVAQVHGISLAAAVQEKFNETSERLGFPERL